MPEHVIPVHGIRLALRVFTSVVVVIATVDL